MLMDSRVLKIPTYLHHMFLLPPFGEVAIYLHVELLMLISLFFQLYDCCNISCVFNKLQHLHK